MASVLSGFIDRSFRWFDLNDLSIVIGAIAIQRADSTTSILDLQMVNITLAASVRSLAVTTDSALSCKGQIPLCYPGRRQVRGWSQTGNELEFCLPRPILLASSEPAGLRQVCDHRACRGQRLHPLNRLFNFY